MSAAGARALEAERQEAAAAAVAQIQAVEEAAVADALASLNDTNSEVTLSTDLGPMKVNLIKVVQVEAAEAADGALFVRVEDAVVELMTETFSEVLTSAGLNSDDSLVLSVVQLNQEDSSHLETDAVVQNASVLSSPALSINFWRADGSRVEVKDLVHPLRFTLEVSDPTAKCGFWVEDTGKWSDEGLNTVSTNSTMIECRTAHLSIFGAIRDVFLKNILLVLKCSTFSTLMTKEAFEKLQDPSWLESPSSILNIIFHVLGVVSIVLAWLYDRKQERLVPWEEREMILMREKAEEGQSKKAHRVSEMEEEGVPKTWSCWSRLMGCCNHSLEYVSHASGGDATLEAVKEAVGNADTAAVNRAISTIQSHKSGIARSQISVFNQINNIERSTESTGNLQRQETNLTKGTNSTKVDDFKVRTKDEGQAAAEAFLQRGWLCRVATLWPASHPWAKATHFSMLAPVRVSVALLVLKINSAAALSAVFFSTGSPTPDADPECFPKKGTADQIVQTFGVGLFTAILGDMIISILFALQVKKVVFSEEWTEERKRRQRLRWNIWTCLFWSVCFVYGGFCELYICLFIANVTGADAASWLQSMGVTLLEDLLLKSFLTAIMLATVATLVLCCKPHLTHKIKSKWIKDEDVKEGAEDGEDDEGDDGDDGEDSDAVEELEVKWSRSRSMESMGSKESMHQERL